MDCNSNMQLIENSSETLDIEKIMQTIAYTNEHIKPVQDESSDHIIFNGYSGVGKSATILALSGQQLYGYHNKAKSPIIKVRNKQGRGGVRIQPEVIAGTFYPGFLTLDNKYNLGKKIQLIDMPGQDDNRGINFLLMNSYFYVRLFQIHQNVKLVYVLKHQDIDQGDKANGLFTKLKVFTSMYGDVDKYYESLIIVISKCVINYNQNDAVQYFNDVSKLALIKSDKNILKLVKKLANKEIPILIVPMPQLNKTGTLIAQENALNVTNQYQGSIINFAKIIKQLKPTNQIKLLSPPLSQADKKKCFSFATKANQQIEGAVSYICYNLIQYFQNILLDVDLLTKKNVSQIAKNMKEKANFIKDISNLLKDIKHQKESYKKKINAIEKLFVQYNIKPLIAKRTNNDQEFYCPKILQLKNPLIMISFLNSLSLNIPNGRLPTEVNVYKLVFQKLINVQFPSLWSKVQKQYKTKTQNSIAIILSNHLQTWQDTNIYKSWEQDYKPFPSFIHKINKHMYCTNNTSIQGVELYFKELKMIEEEVKIKNDDIQQINYILSENKKHLQLILDSDIISEKMGPIIDSKTMAMIHKVTNYTSWGKADVQNYLKQYNQKGQQIIRVKNQNELQISNLKKKAQTQRQQANRWKLKAQAEMQKVTNQSQKAFNFKQKFQAQKQKAQTQRQQANRWKLKAQAEMQKVTNQSQKAFNFKQKFQAQKQKAQTQRQQADSWRLKAQTEMQKATNQSQNAFNFKQMFQSQKQKAQTQRQQADSWRLKAQTEMQKATNQSQRAFIFKQMFQSQQLKAQTQRQQANRWRLKAQAEMQKVTTYNQNASTQKQKFQSQQLKAQKERQQANRWRLKAQAEMQKVTTYNQNASTQKQKFQSQQLKAQKERQNALNFKQMFQAQKEKSQKERQNALNFKKKFQAQTDKVQNEKKKTNKWQLNAQTQEKRAQNLEKLGNNLRTQVEELRVEKNNSTKQLSKFRKFYQQYKNLICCRRCYLQLPEQTEK